MMFLNILRHILPGVGENDRESCASGICHAAGPIAGVRAVWDVQLCIVWYLIFLPLGISGIDSVLVREVGRDRNRSEPMAAQALDLTGSLRIDHDRQSDVRLGASGP